MKAEMPGCGEIWPMLSGVRGVCGVSGGMTGCVCVCVSACTFKYISVCIYTKYMHLYMFYRK